MSAMEVTIWFKAQPEASRLVSGFAAAAASSRARLLLFKAKKEFENTESSWKAQISKFRSYAFTEEVKWEFHFSNALIKGKCYFQMLDPVGYFGTVQFDVNWTGQFVKGFDLGLDHFIEFLLSLAHAVGGLALLVAPKRLPEDIIETRNRRFRENPSRHTPLRTEIDWICGLRDDDPQCLKFYMLNDKSVKLWRDGRFSIFALGALPFDYKDSTDRDRIRDIEAKVDVIP